MSDIEQALIGRLIKEPDQLAKIDGKISEKDFFDINARIAYGAILELWRSKRSIDIIILREATRGTQMSLEWLVNATDLVLNADITSYADIIRKKATVARINGGLRRIGCMQSEEPAEILKQIAALHDAENGKACKESHIVSVLDRFRSEVDENEARGHVGLGSGYGFFNQCHITYQPGHIWIIGAFTSVGKTAFATDMLARFYEQNHKDSVVAFISTEMTSSQMISRYLSNRTGINSKLIHMNKMCKENKARVARESSSLLEKTFYLHDDISEISEIESALRKIRLQEGKLDLVFIDYLQNCQIAHAKSEYAAMSELAKRVQKLGKDLGCTIVCLSQLSNDEAIEDKGILRFKGAGEFAAVADIGIKLARRRDLPQRILCDVRKNRHGPLCRQVLDFVDNWTRLEEKPDEANHVGGLPN